MKNPYIPIAARIEKVLIETEDNNIKTFDLGILDKEAKESFSYLPGQFAEISITGKGEAPFGIASSPTEPGALKFTVNRAGGLTTALHNMEEGDIVGLRGPLGNYYPIEELEGKNLVIVSGGFAFTTLRSLTKYMLHQDNRARFNDITVIYGARSPGLLLYKDELAAWDKESGLGLHVTVDAGDEGWKGNVGFVPTITKQVAPSSKDAYVIVCGPPIMIKFTIPVLEELGFPPERIILSLEMRMKCGIGICGRCNIGNKYVCKDGPVFTLAQLNEMPDEY
ncbi:MAG: FAD/NAD(P)-binding protein [Thermodesulfobacteriota bacterium]|nr:FAD/NAD(P)-binding protein [Thermodesulfobacteriota bacterium]